MEYYLRNQIWSTVFASLLTLLFMWLAYIIMGMVDKFVVTPLRIKRIMNRQGVKGPLGYWFLGNLPEYVRVRKAQAEKDMKTGDYNIFSHVEPYEAQVCEAYGKRHMVWFGCEARIRIPEPDLIRQVLANKDAFKKPQMQMKVVSELMGNGLLTTEGEEWALHRQIVNPAFHQEKLKAMVPIMEKIASAMANEWEEKVKVGGGRVELEMSDYMEQMTADILAHIAFGSSYEKGRRVFQHQLALVNLAFQRLKYIAIPGYSILPTPLNIKMLLTQISISRFLNDIIQSRKDMVNMTKNPSYGDDLLGLLITAASKKTFGKGGKVHFGMQALMDNCKTFFLTGHETTASFLTWTMMLLASHTTWQELARAEVTKVCGPVDHPINADMLDKLKTLTMILNETLRLFPTALDLSRQAVMDVKLGDLDIPKGASLYFPTLAIHHDPELWGANVHDFKPERFANGVAKAIKHPLGFLPFAFGPRFCVGQGFALQEAKYVITIILRQFRFHLSASYRHAPYAQGTLKPKYGVPVTLECL